ncbi:cation:proton antiporter [Candidatus Woesebacteria bacterium]|nr:cation:proton antiporter [Candidatus Woesebacteria bacterium]MCD8507217.1 cation:proton antiporter [Candidatus Woesebacteria bacterium]
MFFSEIALLLAVTVAISLVAFFIRQPLVIAYIVAGFLVGPEVLGWLQSSHELEIFSQAGVVFLLFSVGLHLNPVILKEVGMVSFLTGIGQIVFTTLLGFGLASLLGFDPVASFVIAIALTFSSTIIILKLISDRQDLNKLYAKIAIGFLLIQDIVATLALVVLPLLSNSSGSESIWLVLALMAAKAVAVGGAAALTAWFIIPRVLTRIATSSELLFVLSLAWGLGIAALFGWAGLSLEVGALLAGVLLAASPFATEIASRLRPLRDFFIVTFFLLLGSSLQVDAVGQVLLPALALSVFVLVGNPLIVYVIMQVLGYTRKVSFQAGLTVAQISEFSLIFTALAFDVLALSSTVVSLVTVVGIITIAVSTYLILYSDQIFAVIEPVLKYLPLPVLVHRDPGKRSRKEAHQKAILWFGAEAAEEHLRSLAGAKTHKINLVDYDPQQLESILEPHIHSHYGDASDVEFLAELPWHEVEEVISVIPDEDTNVLIVSYARQYPQIKKVIVVARNRNSAQRLQEQGAHHVIEPFRLSVSEIGKVSAKS